VAPARDAGAMAELVAPLLPNLLVVLMAYLALRAIPAARLASGLALVALLAVYAVVAVADRRAALLLAHQASLHPGRFLGAVLLLSVPVLVARIRGGRLSAGAPQELPGAPWHRVVAHPTQAPIEGQLGGARHPQAGEVGARRVGRWRSLGLPAMLAGEVALIYGRSIDLALVGDDWDYLGRVARGLSAIFVPDGTYHYNPVSLLALFAVYKVFGLHAVAYHVVVFILFWSGAVAVAALAWYVTRSFAIGALSGGVFVAYGTQYEAAIWGGIAFWHTLSTLLFLGGLLLFMIAHDGRFPDKSRRWAYVGFLGAGSLGPFAHEQALSLIVVCALYRLFVLDWGAGSRPADLVRRARGWGREFVAPGLLLLCYLAFKLWLQRRTPIPQVPGLGLTWETKAFGLTLGVFQAFVPGLSWQGAMRVMALPAGPHLYLAVLACALIGALILASVATPLQRFLLLWALSAVAMQVLGVGILQARHLYLLTAPASILWAGLIRGLPGLTRDVLGPLRLPRTAITAAGLLPAALVLGALMTAGMAYSFQQQDAWQAGSRERKTHLAQLERCARLNPAAGDLFLIDLPDYRLSPTGEFVYMYRNGTKALIALAFPGRFERTILVRQSGDPDVATGDINQVTDEDLEQYAARPGTLLLQYDRRSGALQQWAGPSRRLGGATTPASPTDVGCR